MPERLGAARAKGDASQKQLAVIVEERVVLGLVRQHRRVTTLELELNQRWKEGRNFRDDAPLVRLGPWFGHGEIHAIGVRLEQRDAPVGEGATHQVERLAAATRHLVGGVDVGEACESAPGGEVPVRRIHDELHCRRHRLVRVALRGAVRRGARARLRRQPLLDEAVDEGEERAEMVARRADAVSAHQ